MAEAARSQMLPLLPELAILVLFLLGRIWIRYFGRDFEYENSLHIDEAGRRRRTFDGDRPRTFCSHRCRQLSVSLVVRYNETAGEVVAITRETVRNVWGMCDQANQELAMVQPRESRPVLQRPFTMVDLSTWAFVIWHWRRVHCEQPCRHRYCDVAMSRRVAHGWRCPINRFSSRES